MQVVRVGPLPERAIEAAAAFHAKVLPQILAQLAPPRNGEGTHARHGGEAPTTERDLVLVFDPAPHDHGAWRLAAIQDLAREAAPHRVNGIAGDDEAAIAVTRAWLEQAPGVTGQLLAVGNG